MTITRLHISVTVLIALALHGGLALWLTLPTLAPLPPPQTPPLRINLLAAVADNTVNAPIEAPEPPPEPVSEPVAEPVPLPVPEPQPVVKPAPEPQPPTPHRPPEPEQRPEPVQKVQQPTPAEPSVVPLDAVATARYEKLLVAWLEKHKKYPRRAKRLRIEGEGMLRILIDRAGRTQQVTLEQRTGNRLLDKAALEMARRADPFPPMPDSDPRRELEFIVPVAFLLH
jgi:protein TonB